MFFQKPGIFRGKESLEIKYEKQFDELCIFVSEQLNTKANELTVLSFYNGLDYIKKKIKQTTKLNGKKPKR